MYPGHLRGNCKLFLRLFRARLGDLIYGSGSLGLRIGRWARPARGINRAGASSCSLSNQADIEHRKYKPAVSSGTATEGTGNGGYGMTVIANRSYLYSGSLPLRDRHFDPQVASLGASYLDLGHPSIVTDVQEATGNPGLQVVGNLPLM
ncbi:MAG: hypothetical protein ACI9UA_004623 [Pseudoalteromonas tetraodonis]|jgi:hypothetical protein